MRLFRPTGWPMLTKLLVTFGLIALMPLIVTGLYSYDVARQTVLQAQVQSLTSHSSELAARLDLLLIERRQNIRQLASDWILTYFSQTEAQASTEIHIAAQRGLDNLAQSNPYFQAVYLMNPDGEVILSSTENVGLNFSGSSVGSVQRW